LNLYAAAYEAMQLQVYERFQRAMAGCDTFVGKLEAVLDASHQMNLEEPRLAQFLGAVRVDMRRHPKIGAVLETPADQREQFFADLVEFGVNTGEIDPSNRDMARALVITMLVGLTDAVSHDHDRHHLAIEAIKAILNGKLVRAPH
jgi:hypothetical protein